MERLALTGKIAGERLKIIAERSGISLTELIHCTESKRLGENWSPKSYNRAQEKQILQFQDNTKG